MHVHSQLRVWDCCCRNKFFQWLYFISLPPSFGHSTIFRWEYTLWKKPSRKTDPLLLGNFSYLLAYTELCKVLS
jgi:hypothetical protein